LGVEVAADFLVFTAIVWNIWLGIYQAFKTVPEHLLEVSANYELGFVDRMRHLYIPFSIPRIAGNIFPSFADALFYITVSEVFTAGPGSYKAFGIGTIISQLTAQGDFTGVYYSLFFIGIGVVALTFLFSKFSKQAIAKYGIDTSIDIQRRKKHYYLPHWLSHGSSRAFYDSLRTRVLRSQAKGISKLSFNYASKLVPHRGDSIISVGGGSVGKQLRHRGGSKTIKYLIVSVLSICLIYILYSAAQLIFSVPKDQWISLYLPRSSYFLTVLINHDFSTPLIISSIIVNCCRNLSRSFSSQC
jgi:ABC-type anion transport system duplicated permease subunit